jgi:hypothetical protein
VGLTILTATGKGGFLRSMLRILLLWAETSVSAERALADSNFKLVFRGALQALVDCFAATTKPALIISWLLVVF